MESPPVIYFQQGDLGVDNENRVRSTIATYGVVYPQRCKNRCYRF